MMHRIALGLILLASLLSVAPRPAVAQNWPGKPIRIQTRPAGGGVTDIVPRLLSNHLSAALGVPVIVENRPGAGGNIAAGVVARAEPDGRMLLSTGSNQAVNPTLLPNPGFDYERLCLMASGGTPAPVIARRLDAEIAKALQLPEIRDSVAKQGAEVFHLGPAQLGEYLKPESARFAQLLEHSRLRRASQ